MQPFDPSRVPARSAILLVTAMFLWAPNGACSAAVQSDDDAQRVDSQRVGTQAGATQPAATDPQFVVGPHGETLFKARGPDENSSLDFKLIARSTTEGKIVNTDRNFDLTRLPATFKAILGIEPLIELCTATLIGPRVLLTAAHCVDFGSKRNGKWRTVGGTVSRANGTGTISIRSCAMAKAYTDSDPNATSVRNDNDFALCDLVDDFAGVRAENISEDTTSTATGRRLMLAGFGCSNDNLTNGTIRAGMAGPGVLNVGFNVVQTGNADRWIGLEGRVGTDNAILCPGDSGGAAFAGVDDLNATHDRDWKVVAVNSAIGLGPSAANPSYISYLSPLSDPDFHSFMTTWVQERPTRRKICGVHISSRTGNCRR